MEEMWCTWSFLDRKMTARIAVSTTTRPLIISNTDAAHCVRAIMNEQKAIMSMKDIILMRNKTEVVAGILVCTLIVLIGGCSIV